MSMNNFPRTGSTVKGTEIKVYRHRQFSQRKISTEDFSERGRKWAFLNIVTSTFIIALLIL